MLRKLSAEYMEARQSGNTPLMSRLYGQCTGVVGDNLLRLFQLKPQAFRALGWFPLSKSVARLVLDAARAAMWRSESDLLATPSAAAMPLPCPSPVHSAGNEILWSLNMQPHTILSAFCMFFWKAAGKHVILPPPPVRSCPTGLATMHEWCQACIEAAEATLRSVEAFEAEFRKEEAASARQAMLRHGML